MPCLWTKTPMLQCLMLQCPSLAFANFPAFADVWVPPPSREEALDPRWPLLPPTCSWPAGQQVSSRDKHVCLSWMTSGWSSRVLSSVASWQYVSIQLKGLTVTCRQSSLRKSRARGWSHGVRGAGIRQSPTPLLCTPPVQKQPHSARLVALGTHIHCKQHQHWKPLACLPLPHLVARGSKEQAPWDKVHHECHEAASTAWQCGLSSTVSVLTSVR